MIVRASIANIDAKGLAQRLQAAGLDGTCWDHIGTARWGIEVGATLETVVQWPTLSTWHHEAIGFERSDAYMPLRDFLVHTLRDLREESAYVTVDGRLAFILTAGQADPTHKTLPYRAVPVKVESL